MKEYKSLSHTRWDCKYHVVFIPKYRRKKMFWRNRTHLGKILHELAKQKESWILEGHLMSDHVPCISIAVSNVIKGKSAISVARNFRGRRRNFLAKASGVVSTVGLDEEMVASTFVTKRRRTNVDQLNMDWSRS